MAESSPGDAYLAGCVTGRMWGRMRGVDYVDVDEFGYGDASASKLYI